MGWWTGGPVDWWAGGLVGEGLRLGKGKKISSRGENQRTRLFREGQSGETPQPRGTPPKCGGLS